MPIVAECPHCGKRFKADEKMAGKKAKCSRCAHVFMIAAPVAAGVHASPLTPEAAPPPHVTERPTDITLNVDRPAPNLPVAEDLEPRTRPRKSNLGLIGVLAAVIVLGGAAALFGPRLLSRASTGHEGNARNNTRASANATVRSLSVSHVLTGASVGLHLPTPPAWSAQPAAPAPRLQLSDDFRLTIPPQPGHRYDAAATILGAPPGRHAAISATPEAGRPAPPIITIWDLSSQKQSATFKMVRGLNHAMLSPDGRLFAGQAYDDASRTLHVEVWSTAGRQLAHTVSFPAPAPPERPAVLGFPTANQIALLGGGRLQVYDLQTKAVARELVLPSRGDDLCAAASPDCKLVALLEPRNLTLIDLVAAKRIGTLSLPDVITRHSRRTLSPRAIEFSPDGQSLALLFDNRSSARRIAVVEVATGRLTEFHTPAAPVYPAGPEIQWLSDGSGFMVGSGILIDRNTDRQIGQIYGDLADEGLGGVLISLVSASRASPSSPTPGLSAAERALIAWSKPAAGLVLRAVPVRTERSDWVNVSINSASTALYDHLQCVSRHFGNAFDFQSMSQIGRLGDRDLSKFLVVNVEFTAALTDHAPDSLSFRPDQFALMADGLPRAPIGTLAGDGSFNLERPEYDLRRRDKTARRRAIVFPASGKEQTLALRIGSREKPLGVPASLSQPPTPSFTAIAAERLSGSSYTAPDDKSQIDAQIMQAQLGPRTIEPDATEHLPLTLTYEPPRGMWLLTVQFEMTATAPRTISRGARAAPPRLGLLLPDGTHLRPVIELPGQLPVMMSAGERRTHTCLFLLHTTPGRCRLTYEDFPVATIKPDSPPARSSP